MAVDVSATQYQEKSEIFWKKSIDSHLALPELYQRKRQYLTAIVEHLPPMTSGLDIGCGNGEFTSLMLPKVERLVGYDISPGLLEAAKAKFADETRMGFHLADVNAIPEPENSFDIVLCMGVTSCVIDDDKYRALLRQIAQFTRQNGFVIMGDTLSHSQNLLLDDPNGYVAMYRDKAFYLDNLRHEGLELISEFKTADSHGGRTANNLLLLWKPARSQ